MLEKYSLFLSAKRFKEVHPVRNRDNTQIIIRAFFMYFSMPWVTEKWKDYVTQ